MHFPRLPDWLIYAAVVVALLIAAVGRQAHLDAPAAPPPATLAEGAALGPASPFDPAVVVEVADKTQPGAGTAFSIDASGTWVTARHVVEGCARAAIVVGPGRGVEAQVTIDPAAETALLTTDGGAQPLPLGLADGLHRGEQAFHMGFPQGRPGEASSRLIGRENLVVQGRGARTEPVLVWAETGRTDGLKGTLGGLSGAPALTRMPGSGSCATSVSRAVPERASSKVESTPSNPWRNGNWPNGSLARMPAKALEKRSANCPAVSPVTNSSASARQAESGAPRPNSSRSASTCATPASDCQASRAANIAACALSCGARSLRSAAMSGATLISRCASAGAAACLVDISRQDDDRVVATRHLRRRAAAEDRCRVRTGEMRQFR